ncbi:MAG: response regulator transcription factor [Anaerolineales bacterium]|nr:response regulator transcription factor [Anaerolineales bacterium]
MAIANIILIESSRTSVPSFAPALEKKGYSVDIFHKLDKALRAASKSPPDIVVLDAASMRTSGTRMSRAVRARLDGLPIILVSPQGSRPDPGNGASMTLVHPFTPRKLLNRIARLLPGDESYVVEIGPIRLNLAQRKVFSYGVEARLTPKEAKLLEMFILNPGRLLTRKALIREVWFTDYTGDTRTLDVHMSWLRRAIEPDPNHPIFLKTIRGMGYRFDLPD